MMVHKETFHTVPSSSLVKFHLIPLERKEEMENNCQYKVMRNHKNTIYIYIHIYIYIYIYMLWYITGLEIFGYS